MIKLSVITITFNDVKTIEQTIKSVIDQNYSNLEYIIIDGGSTDGTLEILDKYKNKFDYFKSSPDQGVYDAMNKGILQANGDFVGFVNGGDFLYKNTLNNINNKILEQKTNSIFTIADIDYIDLDNKIVGSKICRSNKEIYKRRFYEMASNHLGIFVPLKTFKKFGLFDLKFKYRADFLFTLKLLNNGYQPLNLEKKIGAFRLGGISGGYQTFFENFKIIRSVDGKFSTAFFSTSLAVLKLFFQKNLPLIYSFVASFYYKIYSKVEKKEITHTEQKKIIHFIESELGGGAEKLVNILQSSSYNKQTILTLRKLKKNDTNENYKSLNIKSDGIKAIFFGILSLMIFLFKIKNKKNLILHSHLSKPLYISYLPSLLFGIEHIHTEHNTYNKRRSKFFLYPIEYLIYNSLKYVICISEPTRYELLFYMPSINFDNTLVIENGTTLHRHRARDFSKEKFNLIILGSLTFKKGIDLFIEAMPEVLDLVNKLRIVGSGPEKNNLINLTKKLSLEEYIEFISFADDPSPYIYEADIGIIPSRWEGFSLVAAEMRSSGLPILISDAQGLYNTFSDYNGVYNFKNESKISLKSSFKLMLSDLSSGKCKVANLNNDFKFFSKNSFIERYVNFYRKLNL